MAKMANLHAMGVTDLVSYNAGLDVARKLATLAVEDYRGKLIDAFANDAVFIAALPAEILERVVKILDETKPSPIE